jgi:hypothetical protein
VSTKYYHWIKANTGDRFAYDQRFQNDNNEFPSFIMKHHFTTFKNK